jgi:hypothetical protein
MEVVRLSFDRGERHPSIYNDLAATFFIYDLAKTPSDPERKQALLDLLFTGLAGFKMSGWSAENPILGLSLQVIPDPGPSDSRLRVAWRGCGHEVEFSCESVSVVRLRELNPFRKCFCEDLTAELCHSTQRRTSLTVPLRG